MGGGGIACCKAREMLGGKLERESKTEIERETDRKAGENLMATDIHKWTATEI